MHPVPDAVGGAHVLEVLRAPWSEVQGLPGAVPVLDPTGRLWVENETIVRQKLITRFCH